MSSEPLTTAPIVADTDPTATSTERGLLIALLVLVLFGTAAMVMML
jgi:hypothetical protein